MAYAVSFNQSKQTIHVKLSTGGMMKATFGTVQYVNTGKQKASNWRRTDSSRAAALREAKAAQDLAKMSQMALQIAEAVRHT